MPVHYANSLADLESIVKSVEGKEDVIQVVYPHPRGVAIVTKTRRVGRPPKVETRGASK